MTADPRRNRVARSHGLAAFAFRLGGVFLLGAAAWVARLVTVGAGGWWGPVHMFLAGTVLLALSGAAPLFATTWAAAVPPSRRLAAAQRWILASGVATVVIGYPQAADGAVIVGASLTVGGLLLLGVMLIGVVRRSLLRRFDRATRFYLLAVTCGVIGVSLGGVVGTGGAGSAYLDLRTAHMHLNLVGLVGFTILGTLPTLLPTTVRHRMVSGREVPIAFSVCVAAAVAMTAGAIVGPTAVALGTALAGAAVVAVLGGIVARLGPRAIAEAGFCAVMISTGALWLAGWALFQTWSLATVGHRIFATATLVGVCGVGLVLFGSLAYLIPVLAGPGERLPANFARMQSLPWPRIALANAMPVALVAGAPSSVAAVLAGMFLTDFLIRAARVQIHRQRITATG